MSAHARQKANLRKMICNTSYWDTWKPFQMARWQKLSNVSEIWMATMEMKNTEQFGECYELYSWRWGGITVLLQCQKYYGSGQRKSTCVYVLQQRYSALLWIVKCSTHTCLLLTACMMIKRVEITMLAAALWRTINLLFGGEQVH